MITCQYDDLEDSEDSEEYSAADIAEQAAIEEKIDRQQIDKHFPEAKES